MTEQTSVVLGVWQEAKYFTHLVIQAPMWCFCYSL